MRRTSYPYKRKNIKKQDLNIDIIENNNTLVVQLSLYNLQDYKFPNKAVVFLEAYNRQDIDLMRLGDIQSVVFCEKIKKKLNFFEPPQRSKIKFRIKVVDEKTWRLLGLAENLKEKREADSLLSIRTDSSIHTIYRVDWDDLDHPILIINQDLSECLSYIKPLLAEVVCREILQRLLFFQKDEFDKEEIENHKWIKFAKKYNQRSNLMELSDDDKENWISGVLGEFSKKLKVVKKLKTKLEKNGR